jgi:hypothetical protein
VRPQPGELRRSQNWIGGTRPGNAAFVPPPADRVADLLGDLEQFIHDEAGALPPLVKKESQLQLPALHRAAVAVIYAGVRTRLQMFKPLGTTPHRALWESP